VIGMPERKEPDLDQVRDALRNHDERERADEEDRDRREEEQAEPESPEDE
jgi:hypothetical protein